MNAVSTLPCNACGHRHMLDQFKVRSMVRTLSARHDVPAGSVGHVREWSQYGGPLYYRVAFNRWTAENYAPCEIEPMTHHPNEGLRRIGVAVAVWAGMAAAQEPLRDEVAIVRRWVRQLGR